jgi:hypothetical protein
MVVMPVRVILGGGGWSGSAGCAGGDGLRRKTFRSMIAWYRFVVGTPAVAAWVRLAASPTRSAALIRRGIGTFLVGFGFVSAAETPQEPEYYSRHNVAAEYADRHRRYAKQWPRAQMAKR